MTFEAPGDDWFASNLTLTEKEQKAILLLQEFQPQAEPYYGCFSGGKDSCVIKQIAEKAGINVEWWYSLTTIDPPELVYFIRDRHPDVKWNRPQKSLWGRIAEGRPLPNRRIRWCCEEFKEVGGKNRIKITGIRAAESPRRARQWSEVTAWKGGKNGWVVNPILSWSNYEVWQYIKQEQIPYCCLYDRGFKRLGCLGCPMSYRRKEQLDKYPRYREGWRRAANRAWEYQKANRDVMLIRHHRTFKNADEWFDWWLSNKSMPDENDCQMGLF